MSNIFSKRKTHECKIEGFPLIEIYQQRSSWALHVWIRFKKDVASEVYSVREHTLSSHSDSYGFERALRAFAKKHKTTESKLDSGCYPYLTKAEIEEERKLRVSYVYKELARQAHLGADGYYRYLVDQRYSWEVKKTPNPEDYKKPDYASNITCSDPSFKYVSEEDQLAHYTQVFETKLVKWRSGVLKVN